MVIFNSYVKLPEGMYRRVCISAGGDGSNMDHWGQVATVQYGAVEKGAHPHMVGR